MGGWPTAGWHSLQWGARSAEQVPADPFCLPAPLLLDPSATATYSPRHGLYPNPPDTLLASSCLHLSSFPSRHSAGVILAAGVLSAIDAGKRMMQDSPSSSSAKASSNGNSKADQ